MSIALVTTRGYSNGTLVGTIDDVVTRGYTIGAAIVGPTPDCYLAFTGTITESTLNDAAFVSTITGNAAFTGEIIDNGAGFDGTITDTNAYIGDICND